jgi:hypothetical protein
VSLDARQNAGTYATFQAKKLPTRYVELLRASLFFFFFFFNYVAVAGIETYNLTGKKKFISADTIKDHQGPSRAMYVCMLFAAKASSLPPRAATAVRPPSQD